jgi:broad specificity phosphatase PhoE
VAGLARRALHAAIGRISAALAELPTEAARIAIVAHGGVIRAAVSLILDLAADRLAPVPPGSLTIIETGDWPRLRAYGLTAEMRVEEAAD